MAILILDNNNVYNVELTLTEAEDLVENHLQDYEDFSSKLQRAQHEVRSDNQEVTYIVIKIVRE